MADCLQIHTLVSSSIKARLYMMDKSVHLEALISMIHVHVYYFVNVSTMSCYVSVSLPLPNMYFLP